MNDKDQTVEQEFINTVYTAAETGKMALSELMSDGRQGGIQDVMRDHYSGYDELSRRALRMMADKGGVPKGVSKPMEWMQKGAMRMNSLMDRSDSHLAEMILEGNNMGIVNIRKALNECESRLSDEVREFGYDSVKLIDSFNDELRDQL